jgi:hypothetical protein
VNHIIYLTPAKYHKAGSLITKFANHYSVEYNETIILTSSTAEFDAARYLMSNDLAKESDTLTTYVNGKKSMIGNIKWFAEHTVEDSEKISAHFTKWEPLPDMFKY